MARNTVIATGMRCVPDVAFDADPNTGVAVYDSYDGGSSPWFQVGGTSLAAPCWAGLVAIANQIRVSAGLTNLDGPSQTLPALYALPAADFHDITSAPARAARITRQPPGYRPRHRPGHSRGQYARARPGPWRPLPDLTVTATHAGNFTPGRRGRHLHDHGEQLRVRADQRHGEPGRHAAQRA